MTSAGSIPRELTRLQKPAMLAAAAGVILMAVGFMWDSEQFYRAYHFAWLFCLGLSLGSLAIVMLSHLVSGEWAWVIRRLGEAAAANLVVVLILFIPLIFGFKHLFPWAVPELVKEDHILSHRLPYMSPTWVVGRALIYFAIWIGLAVYLRSCSMGYDRTNDVGYLRRAQRASAFGVVTYILTMTLASIDWIMTLDAHWFSHIIGFVTVVGQAGAAMALMVRLLCKVSDRDPIAPVLDPKHLNDLGNLLLTLMILWAYMSFAQFLIIWMGNTQDDSMWYAERGFAKAGNPWVLVALALIVFHFFIPFFILLSRNNKRRARTLGSIALWILAMRLIDVYWWVIPTPSPANARVHGAVAGRPSWLDPAAAAMLIGIWMTTFIWQLKGRPLLSRGAPAEEQDDHAKHAKPTTGLA